MTMSVRRAFDFPIKRPGSRLLPALAAAAAIAGASPASAGWFSPPTGTWCALEAVGLNDCSYFSYQQCIATLSGIGGTCQPNLQAPPQVYPGPPRRHAKVRHRRNASAGPPPGYGPVPVPPPPGYR
jgi:Protein of unknown function (DUF3551)